MALTPAQQGKGNFFKIADLMQMDMSFQAVKKAIELLLVLSIAAFLIFFVTGFIFYKHPKSKPLNHSITMPIERPSAELSSQMEGKEKEEARKADEQLTSAAKQLPRLNERQGKLRVATRYNELLAQMQLILEDKRIGQVPEVMGDQGGGFDPTDDGIPTSFPIGETIRERMVLIGDVLEYASSQAGITVDLLAAVAWAESKMLPYAINVKGKTYHFTSKESALKALRGLETDDLDIGLFQVNYRLWGEPLGLHKEDLLNSRVCAIIAAMILKYNLQIHSDPWVAIGKYHSGDKARMKAYQTKVSRGLMIIRKLSVTPQQDGGSELPRVSQGINRGLTIRTEGRLYS